MSLPFDLEHISSLPCVKKTMNKPSEVDRALCIIFFNIIQKEEPQSDQQAYIETLSGNPDPLAEALLAYSADR